jgi:hypothetical protein
MATKQELRTFKNIVDQIMGLMKYQSTDTISRNKIKEDVQRAYLTEVMPFHEWPWLRNKINIQAPAYFATGTASVTQGSVSVTLTETLTTSRKNYSFSIDGQNEIYKIKDHVGGSTSLTLDVPYTGQTSATAKFKIWTDLIPLPSEATQILEASHPFSSKPMDGFGLQEIRRYATLSPKAEGRPRCFSLSDYIDPDPYSTVSSLPATLTRQSNGLIKTLVFAGTLGSTSSNLLLQVGDRIEVSGADNYDYNIEAIVSSISTTSVTNDTITYTGLAIRTESATSDVGITVKKSNTEGYEKQKYLHIYPSISNTTTTITVDYTKEIEPLVEDTDEPALPLADRIILFWYGLSYSYSRERNPEEAIMYRTLAEQRLARMAGNTNESTDKPILIPSRLYLNTKRSSQKMRRFGSDSVSFGGGSTTNPLGTPDQVAVFGTDGTLQSSSTISTTELGALNGIQGNIEARLNAIGLPTGSVGNRVLISSDDPTPAIIESDVDVSAIEYLEGTAGLTSVVLTDNTASAATAASFDITTITTIFIDYSISRGTAYESGKIVLVTDGSTASMSQGGIASIGDVGTVLSADVSSGNLRLRYTTTSTGTNATLKYKSNFWLA